MLHTIAVGHRIDDVAINRDGTTLYAPVHWTNGSTSSISPPRDRRHIDLPGRPNGVTVSPDGHTAIVTATQREPVGDRGRAYVVDLRTNRITATLRLGLTPIWPPSARRHARLRLHLRPEEYDGGNLYVFRTEDWLLIATVFVGEWARTVDVSPDGSQLCVLQIRRGSLAVVDSDSNELSGYVTGMGGDPNGIAVNPNGVLVYVSALSDGYVDIVDTTTGTSTEWIDMGFEPHHLVLNEYRAELYVAHNRQLTVPSQKGLVIVVDLHTHQISQRVEIDDGARGMALSDDGTRLYCVSDEAVYVFAFDRATSVGCAPVGSRSRPPPLG